jgi:hypothetical protein
MHHMRLPQGCAALRLAPGYPAKPLGQQTMRGDTRNAFSPSFAGFAFAFLHLMTGTAQAAAEASRYWHDTPSRTLPAGMTEPDAYRAAVLDFPAAQAALQIGGDVGQTISLPMPSGGFRLTAFDNFPMAGTTASADLTLQVDSGSGPFAVTAPAAGVTWDPLVSATEAVTWNVASTDVAPVSCANVDIDVYTGGGFASSTALLAQGVPNNGSVVVNVPNMQTATARVRVRCSDNIFFAMSPGNFTINGPDLIFADGFD